MKGLRLLLLVCRGLQSNKELDETLSVLKEEYGIELDKLRLLAAREYLISRRPEEVVQVPEIMTKVKHRCFVPRKIGKVSSKPKGRKR